MPLDSPDGVCEHGAAFAGSEMPESNEDERAGAAPRGRRGRGGLDDRAGAPGEVVTAVWARAGRQARAELELPGGSLRLDFEHPHDVSGPAGEVRFVRTGEYEGWFPIRVADAPGGPLALRVRTFHELSSVPRYFQPEPRQGRPPLPPAWEGLPYAALARVLEAREASEWRPAAVW